MTQKNKREQSTLASPLLSSLHLEADRCSNGMSVVLCGIIGISDFSECSVLLKSHGGRIVVSGGGLSIKVYENNSVEIVGRVEEIRFNYGKN